MTKRIQPQQFYIQDIEELGDMVLAVIDEFSTPDVLEITFDAKGSALHALWSLPTLSDSTGRYPVRGYLRIANKDYALRQFDEIPPRIVRVRTVGKGGGDESVLVAEINLPPLFVLSNQANLLQTVPGSETSL